MFKLGSLVQLHKPFIGPTSFPSPLAHELGRLGYVVSKEPENCYKVITFCENGKGTKSIIHRTFLREINKSSDVVART